MRLHRITAAPGQRPSVPAPGSCCPRRLLPTILRRRLFCPLALTSSSLSASQPVCWPTSAQQQSSQPPPSWRRQFSVPRPGPRRVESIRLTSVTWPNEIAFELRNLRLHHQSDSRSAQQHRPALSAVQFPHAHGIATIRHTRRLPRALRRCSWRRTACWVTASTSSCPPGPVVSSPRPLLSCRNRAAQIRRPSCARPGNFSTQRRQPSPGTEHRRTPHAIGATVAGIFYTDCRPPRDPFEGPVVA